MAGVYFEDLTVGRVFKHSIRRTVTEADNVFFSALTHNPAQLHLDEEFHIQQNLTQIIRKKLIASAHDVSDGGLFATLVESAIAGKLGFEVESDQNFRKDAYWFGESQSRVVISVSPQKEDELVNYLNTHNVPFTRLGEVTGASILIDNEDFGTVQEWEQVYLESMAKKMEHAI